MANTYVTMTEVAEDLLQDFENNLLVTATTWRGYEDDISNAHTDTGGSVTIRKPIKYNVGTSATITGTTSTVEKSTTLTVDQRRNVEANFTTNDLTFYSKDKFRERFITPMAKELANAVDLYVADEMGKAINFFSGTAGTKPSSYGAVADTGALMNKLGIPMADRWLGLSEDSYSSLMTAGTLQNSNDIQINRDITRRGQIGMINDMQSFHSIFMKRQIAGIGDSSATPASGLVAAGNVKTTVTSGSTLVVENLQNSDTGVFQPGDKITIAGAFSVNPITQTSTGQLMQFTITDAAAIDSSASGEATITVSPAIISASTDPYRNISNTSGIVGGTGSAISLATSATVAGTAATVPYEINMGYVPSAVLFAAPPLAMPKSISGEAAGRATDPDTKVSIRMIEDYDVINDKVITRADVIFGVQVLDDRIVGLLG